MPRLRDFPSTHKPKRGTPMKNIITSTHVSNMLERYLICTEFAEVHFHFAIIASAINDIKTSDELETIQNKVHPEEYILNSLTQEEIVSFTETQLKALEKMRKRVQSHENAIREATTNDYTARQFLFGNRGANMMETIGIPVTVAREAILKIGQQSDALSIQFTADTDDLEADFI